MAELDGDAVEAEVAYRQAIETSEQQGALLYSLRAATALARLCESQRRASEADAVLRPIYDRFTEGFDWIWCARAVLEGR